MNTYKNKCEQFNGILKYIAICLNDSIDSALKVHTKNTVA